jgi:hypothetical protein
MVGRSRRNNRLPELNSLRYKFPRQNLLSHVKMSRAFASSPIRKEASLPRHIATRCALLLLVLSKEHLKTVTVALYILATTSLKLRARIAKLHA